MDSITLNLMENHIPLKANGRASSDWTGLAKVLDGDAFLQLKLFTIHVTVSTRSLPADLVALFGRIFPRLLVRKVLRVEFLM
jgi:hypothetical protein